MIATATHIDTTARDSLKRDKAALLEALREAGASVELDGRKVKCPKHDDGKASAAVYEDEDGAWRVKCHTNSCGWCGDVFDVRALKGGALANVLPMKPKENDKGKRGFDTCDAAAEWMRKAFAKDKGEPVTIAGRWQWENGLVTVRYEHGTTASGKPDKDIRQFSKNGTGWLCNASAAKGARPPLYQSAIRDASTVVIVEGEQKADALRALGFDATTFGAAKMSGPNLSDITSLAGSGRTIVILPDNDGEGEAFAGELSQRLVRLDDAPQVKIVRIPGLERKGDCIDFIADRRSDGKEDSAIRAELLAHIEAAPIVEKDAGEGDVSTPKAETPSEAKQSDNAREIVKMTTDIGNAARFVRDHGENVRWCALWQKCLIWNKSRWEVDEREAVLDLAMKSALRLFDEAKSAQSDGERDELAKHAVRSQKRERLAAMIALAKPHLAITPNELDADIWLLNCPNGTIDLRTGTLRAHRKADYITKIAGAAFDAEAKCPTFDAVVFRALRGDATLIQYTDRYLGHSLTGDISEQVMHVWFGEGANSKSTIIDAVMGVMGDYADTAPPDLLMQRKHDEHPTEIAGLDGKRLIVASESEKNRKLKIQLVKRLTGDKMLKGRFMRGDFFSFTRRFKVLLVTNNRPRVDEATEAVWRRLRLVPFDVVIPAAERDARLHEKLESESAGILARLVRGCLDWQAHGLGDAQRVSDATAEYRLESDVLRGFVDECCELKADAWTRTKELRERYVTHCEQSGDRAISGRDFTDALTSLGCVAMKRYGSRGWQGVRLVKMDGWTAVDTTSGYAPCESEVASNTEEPSTGVHSVHGDDEIEGLSC